MWPLDCLTQFLPYEIQAVRKKLGWQKHVFVAMEISEETDKDWDDIRRAVYKLDPRSRFEIFTREVKLDKKYSSLTDKNHEWSQYFPHRADENRAGDLFLDIITKIILSDLIICDITPKFVKEDTNGEKIFRFNENVMIELGMAMAWKTKEQVVIVCKKKVRTDVVCLKNSDGGMSFNHKYLPFNLRTTHVNLIENFEKNKNEDRDFTAILKKHKKYFEIRKDVIVENSRNKIDHISAKELINRRHGLMMTPEQDAGAIRRLLDMHILRFQYFPNGIPFTYSYCLTEFGKIVLKGIDNRKENKIYPDALIDLYFVRIWMFDVDGEFKRRKKEYEEFYNFSYDDAYATFIHCILEEQCGKTELRLIIELNKKDKKKDVKLMLFDRFLDHFSESHSELMWKIIDKWMQRMKKKGSKVF